MHIAEVSDVEAFYFSVDVLHREVKFKLLQANCNRII